MIYLFNNKKELNKIIPRNNLISAIQELEKNGLYLAEVEVPLFYKTEQGQIYNHKKAFDNASFFGHFDAREKFQLYKIHTRKIDGRNLTVAGIHLFFDEAKAMDVIRDKRMVEADAKAATNAAFNSIGWNVKEADTTNEKSIDFIYLIPLEARKKIIETYNIEFDYDFTFDGKKILAKNIYIRNKLGRWTGDRYHYGTNILSITQEQDEAEVYTAAIGRGKGDDAAIGFNSRITFTDLEWSKDGISKPVGQDYIEIPSATQQYGYYDSTGNVRPRIAVVDFSDEPDRYVLANRTYEWLTQNCVPKTTYSTTVAKIGDYYLGDEIGIIYTEIELVKKARVEKMRVNLLNYNKTELELGDYSYFKEDKAQQNAKKEIEKLRNDSDTYITQLRKQFDADYDEQVRLINERFNQAKIEAEAQVLASETRMTALIDSETNALKQDITDSYNSSVQQAESKVQSAKDSITTEMNTMKQETDAELAQFDSNLSALDQKMVTADTNLTNSINNANTQIAAANANITSINTTINTVKTDISKNASDIQSVKTTVASHTTDITNMNNQITLRATKTEVTDAINNISVGGRNYLLDSRNIMTSQNNTGLGKAVRNADGSWTVTPDPGKAVSQYMFLTTARISIGRLPIGKTCVFSMDVTPSVNLKITMYMSNTTYTAKSFDLVAGKKTRIFCTFIPNDDTKNPTLVFMSNIADGVVTYDNMKVEIGTTSTDWTPAPEDIQGQITKNTADITIANNEIAKRVLKTDYDTKTGQMQTQINTAISTADKNTQTIAVLNGDIDKVEQWQIDKGTTIEQTANAISQKVWNTDIDAKTGDITNKLNTISNTVDSNTATILQHTTRLDGVDKWQTDKGSVIQQTQDAITNKVWSTDINNATGSLQTQINTVKQTADSNTALITSTKTTVDSLNQWRTDKGSLIDQTINAVSTKVWTNDINALDINNRNYQLNITIGNSMGSGSIVSGNGIDTLNMLYKVSTTTPYLFLQKIVPIEVNETYTLSFYVTLSSPTDKDYTYKYGIRSGVLADQTFVLSPNVRKKVSYTFKAGAVQGQFILYPSSPVSIDHAVKLEKVMLVKGNKIVDWMPAPEDATNRMTEISATADAAKMQANTVASDYVKQSAVITTSDSVQIGSKIIKGDTLASVISVTPSNVDIITKVMRVTGDMAVAGDIKSLSLTAVYADIANLRTNVLTADSVTATALKVDQALIDKLMVNNLLVNKLIADTAMINTIKTKSLEAVYADIAKLRTNILIANVITAEHLTADVAMIDKLFATEANITRLTSKEIFAKNIQAINIDLNRAMVTGSVADNYIKIVNDELTQFGRFTRTWRGKTTTNSVFTQMKNGYIRFRNNDIDRSLYLSEFGISTMLDGTGDYVGVTGSSGSILWWDPTYSPSGSYGITINSYGGVAALTSDTNRVMLDSYLSVNLESKTAPLNFRPEKDNSGNNSFQMSIVDSANPSDTDGFLMYGSEVNGWGAGLRFSKAASEQTVYVVNGKKERGGSATLDAGILKANDIKTRDSAYSVYWNNRSGGTTGGVSGLQTLRASGIKTKDTDSDLYLATQNSGWVRVTDGYGYNSGGTVTYRGIAASEHKTMSHYTLKKEITEWEYDVLEIIKNEWQTYQYKLNNDPGGEFKRGTVIGPGYKTIPELVDGEGVKMYEMATWSMEAIKQLIFKVEALEEKLNQNIGVT